MTKTNDQIYDKCIDIEQHVIRTNGKVRLNRWIANSALTVSTFLAGAIIIYQVF